MGRDEPFPNHSRHGGAGRSLISEVLYVRGEIEKFNARWKPLEGGEPAPGFTWEELERQLVDLAPTEKQAELAHGLLARTKAFAAYKPPEMVLRELLCIASLILEERAAATNLDDTDR